MSASRGHLALAVAVAATAALFAQALGFGLVWDDRALVLHNPWLASWTGVVQAFTHDFWGFLGSEGEVGRYYRPLIHLLFFLVRSTLGSAPWALHALVVAAHLGATALVGVVTRNLLAEDARRESLAPAAAALLFGVHPVHLEAVAWVSGIADVLATLGVLGALALVGRPGRVSVARAVAVSACALAASLSKEPGALAFPLAAAWLLARRPDRRSALTLGGALAAGLGLFFALRASAMAGVAIGERHPEVQGLALLGTGLALLLEQVAAVLAPVSPSSWHALVPAASLLEPRVLGGLVVVGALGGGAWAAWRRGRPAVALPLLLTLWALLPGTLVHRLGENAFAERYAYLPSAGLALAAGVVLARWLTPPLRLAVVLGVLAVGGTLATLTALQLPTWKDQAAFFLEMERTAPDAPPLAQDLGVVWLERGQPAKALTYLVRMKQPTAEGWATRAVAHAQLGQVDEARTCLAKALAITPDSAPALANLCRLERQAGRLTEARAACARAVAVAPTLPQVRLMNAQLLRALGDQDAARAEFRAVLELDPANQAAQRALAGP